MELRDISYIVAMNRYGSISQAAKELYVPQPTLSNVLKRVETELGKMLFVRTKAGLTLTPAGSRFIHMAEKLLEMKEAMLEEMEGFEGERKKLRIGSPDIWCSRLVAPVAATFLRQHAGLCVEFHTASSTELEAMLERDDLDLAVLHLPLMNMEQYDFRELFDEQILVAISRKYWETYSAVAEVRSEQITLQDLANQRFIFTSPDRAVRKKTEIALKNNRISYTISAVTDNLEASLVLAEAGDGVAFISDKVKKMYEKDYDLTFLHADNFLPKWKVVVAKKKGVADVELINAFGRELVQYAWKFFPS